MSRTTYDIDYKSKHDICGIKYVDVIARFENELAKLPEDVAKRLEDLASQLAWGREAESKID